MARQHDKQFKLDAIQYYEDHKDLGVRGCAENLGIGYSTLTKWLKDFRESGDISVRGSGNYASDEQKEIARLRRESVSYTHLDVYKRQDHDSSCTTGNLKYSLLLTENSACHSNHSVGDRQS